MDFNIDDFRKAKYKNGRYARRLAALSAQGRYTPGIEKAVESAVKNVVYDGIRSFVIYGEPQSGKTELMIALTAALLDNKRRIVVILLNDNVQLLSQNLERFRRSGLDPAPRNYSEAMDPDVSIAHGEWVLFCKKNPRDLTKLNEKLCREDGVAVIDDEADYATPNSKINQKQKTRINELVEHLLKKEGVYIGVTATPARLDLNNTFNNDKERWVMFAPHPEYTGQEQFFPIDASHIRNREFKLTLLPAHSDDPRYLREALFRFFLSVAYLNNSDSHNEQNYSMLIHTSGKRADHSKDYTTVNKTLRALIDRKGKRFESYVRNLWKLAAKEYAGRENDLVHYVLDNLSRTAVIVMNSDIDKRIVDFQSATNPAALFTVAIGGNIVSRGVTFENLLSMYFTRDVKHKIQQDTYIQRARMFGTRGKYLKHFELTIPDYLYRDWHRCFLFHRLALESIRTGNGSPVWLENKRISTVAGGSIDKATVVMDQGEMGFGVFEYADLEVDRYFSANFISIEDLQAISRDLGGARLPQYIIDFVMRFSRQGKSPIACHDPLDISQWADDTDKIRIERRRGFLSSHSIKAAKYKDALHHFVLIHNGSRNARIFYKYAGSIKFIKNAT